MKGVRTTPRFRAPSGDPLLLIAVGTLVLGGLVLLASASSVTSFSLYGSSFTTLGRQLQFFALGVLLFGFTASTDYRRWRSWSFVLLLVSIGLLVAVFLPGIGTTLQGARRWIALGPVLFQPSELAKPALILALALWLERTGGRGLKGEHVVPFIIPVVAVSGLVLLQPDLGTVIVIAATAVALYFAAGATLKQFVGLVTVFVLVAGIAAATQPYRLERLKTYLNPAADPQGSGYHVTRSLAAIQEGGWFGKGYGASEAKTGALPEAESDSIFAVTVEELGAVTGAAIIGLYVLLGARGLAIARRAPDSFGRNIAVGITVGIVLQAFINIGALTGVIPLTGVPLPLISAGGSSLAVTMGAIGILLSIARESGRDARGSA